MQRGRDHASTGPTKLVLARLYLAGAIFLLVVLIALFELLGKTDDATGGSPTSASEVVTLTEYDLLSRAELIAPAAFWVGPLPGVDAFELERDGKGSLFVRYLPDDQSVDPSELLTVATYPLAEAQRSLELAARAEGKALSQRLGFVALNSGNSTYVVFEDQPELQIEVFSPRRGEAARLVYSGSLTPLHWTPLG